MKTRLLVAALALLGLGGAAYAVDSTSGNNNLSGTPNSTSLGRTDQNANGKMQMKTDDSSTGSTGATRSNSSGSSNTTGGGTTTNQKH